MKFNDNDVSAIIHKAQEEKKYFHNGENSENTGSTLHCTFVSPSTEPHYLTD